MRTEQDLRDAFNQLAGTAPDATDILASTRLDRRPPAHRRPALVIGTALVTAAAAIATPIVISRVHNGSAPAGQDGRNIAWTRWIDLPVPRRMTMTVQVHTPNRQDYELLGFTGSPWATVCQLQLHRNGDFNSAQIPTDSPTVDLGGRKAQVVTSTVGKPFVPEPRGYRFALLGKLTKTLVWQPGTGLWALLSCESQRELGTAKVPQIDGPREPNLALATTIAKSVSPGTRNLGSPVKLGKLPDGVRARRITYAGPNGIPGSGQDFAIVLSDGNPATGYRKPKPKGMRMGPKGMRMGIPAYLPQPGDDLEIWYTTSKMWDQYSRDGVIKPDATIQGMKAYFVNDPLDFGMGASKLKSPKSMVRLEGGGVAVMIHSLNAHPSIDQLRQIAEHLQLTHSPTNPATWFDAATAIP